LGLKWAFFIGAFDVGTSHLSKRAFQLIRKTAGSKEDIICESNDKDGVIFYFKSNGL
jgi:hypothetical protein